MNTNDFDLSDNEKSDKLCNQCSELFAELCEGYCERCFNYLFPDINSDKYMTKEKMVARMVIDKFIRFEWSHNKRIEDGCSRKRPDLIADLLTHAIVVEIDENAHRNYDVPCDNVRTMLISRDLAHRPIVFIRFNPDSYCDSTGKKIPSCWDKDYEIGEWYIKNNSDWVNRINVLIDTIQYWIEHIPDKTIQIVKLFFDHSDNIETQNIRNIKDGKNQIYHEIINPNYYCNLCSYAATTNSNLIAHYKTKKHEENLNDQSVGKFNNEVKLIYEETNVSIDYYKKLGLIRNEYNELNDYLKAKIDQIPEHITKSLDNANFVCTNCGKFFPDKIFYKKHVNECGSLKLKHQTLIQITSRIIIQLKQLLEVCKIKVQNPHNITVAPCLKKSKTKEFELIKQFYDESKNRISTLEKEKLELVKNLALVEYKNKKLREKNHILETKCKTLKKQRTE